MWLEQVGISLTQLSTGLKVEAQLDNIEVPTLCILNAGTVLRLYMLCIGTVPKLCILNEGTVHTLCILETGTVPLMIPLPFQLS